MGTENTLRRQARVGFIGLGSMGHAMAENLAREKSPLCIHDIDPERAGTLLGHGCVSWAETASEVARRSDIICLCLPSPAIVDEVLFGRNGVGDAAEPGQIVIDHSTISVAQSRDIAARFASTGIGFLDAPVSGGPAGARNRTLAIWSGGARATFAECLYVLTANSRNPAYLGPAGSGLIAKLVHNCASQAMQCAIAESFVIGVKAGLDPLVLWGAMREGAAGRRRSFDGIGKSFLTGNFTSTDAALHILDKDIRLAIELATHNDVQVPITQYVATLFRDAMLRGWENLDHSSVMLLIANRAEVILKIKEKEVVEVLERDATGIDAQKM